MKLLTVKIACVGGCYLESPASKIAEIPAVFPLHDLCDFILDSFRFDNDHLHEYFIENMDGYCQQQKIQNENLSLAEMFPLEKNQALFMNFDFGDDWLFKITQQKKSAAFDKNAYYPRIIKQTGKNPEQYPLYEDYQ